MGCKRNQRLSFFFGRFSCDVRMTVKGNNCLQLDDCLIKRQHVVFSKVVDSAKVAQIDNCDIFAGFWKSPNLSRKKK